MKRLIILLPVVLLFVNACKREACNQPLAFNYDPEGTTAENCIWVPSEVNISFEIKYGDQDVYLNQELVTADGRKISFSYVGMYLTQITMYEGDSMKLLDNDVMLLKADNKVHTAFYLPNGSVDSLVFNIGVDPLRNDSADPTILDSSNALAPKSPTMFWGWTSGYRFFSINGNVDSTLAIDGSSNPAFEYHIGTNELLRRVSITQVPTKSGSAITYNLVLDLELLLKDVDFTSELETHTAGNFDLALKIANNAPSAIYAE